MLIARNNSSASGALRLEGANGRKPRVMIPKIESPSGLLSAVSLRNAVPVLLTFTFAID